jgi:hypothetical protein
MLWQFRTLVASATFIMLLFGWMVGQPVIKQINSFATDTWHCLTTECNPIGPAVSWQEQITQAESVAHIIDPDAILTQINASPAAYKFKEWHANDALEIKFDYIMSDGRYLTVRLWDTAPQNVWTDPINTELSGDHSTFMHSLKHKAEIDTALAQISVSPRRAIDATLADAQAMEQSKGNNMLPRVNLSFDRTFDEEPLPDTDIWYVHYRPTKNGESIYGDLTQETYLTQYLRRPQFTVETSSGVVENITDNDATIPGSTP